MLSNGELAMKMHSSITLDRVAEAVEREEITLDNPGFCICCGCDAEGVEPDARGYTCDECGQLGVYSASELLIVLAL